MTFRLQSNWPAHCLGFLAVAAALAVLSATAQAQATQCNAPGHGSGKAILSDVCNDSTSAPGTDIHRIGAWVEGTNLVTSVGMNIPFNAAGPPPIASTEWSVDIGIGTTGAAGASAGTCYFTDSYWSSGDTQLGNLWTDNNCTGASTTLQSMTYRWQSYAAPGASNPRYYCNEIDTLFPLASIGNPAAGVPIQWMPRVGSPSAPGVYYALDTFDTAGNLLDQTPYALGTFTVNTPFNIVPSTPTLSGSVSGTTVTLTMTRGADNFVAPGFGFYAREGATLLNGGYPITANGGYPANYVAPGGSAFWPSGAGPYTLTLTGVSIGTHTYTLREANCRGESAPATVTVTVLPPPPVCAPASQAINAGASVAFSATGGDGTYSWSVAPTTGVSPSSGSAASFNPTFATAGSFTVTLTSGTQSTTCTVTVNSTAISCSPATQSVLVGSNAALSATGPGPFTWSAPGGTPSSGSGTAFTVSYAAAGSNTVTLTSGGNTATCTVTATSTPPPGNQPPVAGPKLYTITLGTSFSSSASTLGGLSTVASDPDGTIASYATCTGVPAGQGTLGLASATGHFTFVPVGTTPYSTSFTYRVTDNGGLASTCATVTLNVVKNLAPKARFSFAPSAVQIGESVGFTDASTDPDAGDSIASWRWTFGDGATATGRNPTHSFGTVGTYTVCLTVTDTRGTPSPPECIAVGVTGTQAGQSGGSAAQAPAEEQAGGQEEETQAGPRTLAVSAGDPITVTPGSQVVMTATCPGASPAATYSWQLVSGTSPVTVSTQGSSATFTAPAHDDVLYFQVQCRDGQDSGSAGLMVTVRSAASAPVARITGAATGAAGTALALDASGSVGEGALTYSWTQVSGSPAALSGGHSPTATLQLPAQPGTLTVLLAVQDATGSTDATTFDISVLPATSGEDGAGSGPPGDGFSATAHGSAVTVQPLVAAQTYTWDFDDGSEPQQSVGATTHTYAKPGTYHITMRAGTSDFTQAATVVAPESASDAARSDASRPATMPPWLPYALAGFVVAFLAVGALMVARRRGRVQPPADA